MRLFAGTSFDQPPVCDRCGQLETACDCSARPAPPALVLPPEKQIARLRIEKRKNGKRVTTISGLDPAGNHLAELLAKLKNACGAGGTVQVDVIEIQGDHEDRIRGLLKELGYRVQ